MLLHTAALSLLLLLFQAAIPASAVKSSFKALIVTGQNNHDWHINTPILKKILTNSGLFHVDIIKSPEHGQNMSNFAPAFSLYDVVVLNYYGDSWPEKTRETFVHYVRSGGGVVVYHMADHAFPNWKEYNAIIGLSGGAGRTASTGPYVFWKDGKLAKDLSAGRSGYHGRAFAFPVIIRNENHPITKGLPHRWMHAQDELYSLMRGSTDHLTILATAYSDPAYGGSGRHEPVLFTKQYGKGRIFHTVLGHTWKEKSSAAVECAGFITTFQRGSEWAASGKVTQKIPGDFPAVHTDTPTPAQVRIWPKYKPPSLKNFLIQLKNYQEGQNDSLILQLNRYVFANRNNTAAKTACEREFIAFLKGRATLTAKMAVCRHLASLGSPLSIPVLEKMLQNKETADPARYALEKIPGDRVDQILIDFSKKTKGKLKLGIISSLANRKTQKAVPLLKVFLYEPDANAATAAASALGQIGTPEAAEILLHSLDRLHGRLQIRAAYGLLSCANQFLEKKEQSKLAYPYFRRLQEKSFPRIVRQASARGLIQASPYGAEQAVLDILKGNDPDLYRPAVDLIPQSIPKNHIGELCPLLSHLPDAIQVQLLDVFSRYKLSETRLAAVSSLKSDVPYVQTAAVKALESIGDASTVELMAAFAAQSAGTEQTAARSCLLSLKGPDINQAVLTGLVKTEDPKIQIEFLRAVDGRGIRLGTTLALNMIGASYSQCRIQAIRTCRTLASPSDLPRLLSFLLQSDSQTETHALESTIAAVAKRISVAENRGNVVSDLLVKTKDIQNQAKLLRVLGKIGDNTKLAFLRSSLKDDHLPIRDAAVRALAEWPDTSPLFDLLQTAKSTDNPTHRILAQRAAVRMIGISRYQSPEWAIQRIKEILNLSPRREEKIMILSVLPAFPCESALRLAESFLGDNTLQKEAEAASEKIKKTLHPEVKK